MAPSKPIHAHSDESLAIVGLFNSCLRQNLRGEIEKKGAMDYWDGFRMAEYEMTVIACADELIRRSAPKTAAA